MFTCSPHLPLCSLFLYPGVLFWKIEEAFAKSPLPNLRALVVLFVDFKFYSFWDFTSVYSLHQEQVCVCVHRCAWVCVHVCVDTRSVFSDQELCHFLSTLWNQALQDCWLPLGQFGHSLATLQSMTPGPHTVCIGGPCPHPPGTNGLAAILESLHEEEANWVCSPVASRLALSRAGWPVICPKAH